MGFGMTLLVLFAYLSFRTYVRNLYHSIVMPNRREESFCINPLSHFVTGLLRRLLWVPKGTVVARFVAASGWKLAYTHNECRQSSLKATQCCGSALPPKTGAQSGIACGGGVLIVQNTTMPWFFSSLLIGIAGSAFLQKFVKIH